MKCTQHSQQSRVQTIKYAVKREILKACELVPEAYCQQFCEQKCKEGETYMGFAQQKYFLTDRVPRNKLGTVSTS